MDDVECKVAVSKVFLEIIGTTPLNRLSRAVQHFCLLRMQLGERLFAARLRFFPLRFSSNVAHEHFEFGTPNRLSQFLSYTGIDIFPPQIQ